MQIRLHDRSEASVRPNGLSCDNDGLRFGGDHPLIEAREGAFGRVFHRRPMREINRLLSTGYGAAVDLAEREPLLDRIAHSLTKGDVAHAQLLALQLRLPDLDEVGAERLAKADQLLRFNPNHDDQGRFASAPGADGGLHTGKTPGGTVYSTAIALTPGQTRALGSIVDYGLVHGYSADQIKVAVNLAFSESSLGREEHNRDGRNAAGLFQYQTETWRDRHGQLDRSSDEDQIAAAYSDISRFQARYAAGQASGAIPASLPFGDYMKEKHVRSNTIDWTGNNVDDFRSSSATLAFHF